jgi:DEAD/DEAH box helicase domain-containing protein
MSEKQLELLLKTWREDSTINSNIITWKEQDGNEGNFCAIPEDLHPYLKSILNLKGIDKIYSHQAQAWSQIRDNRNIVVQTGTASGKSLCYTIPIVEKLLTETNTRALCIFPTKALTADQLTGFETLLSGLSELKGVETGFSQPWETLVATYDGDTTSSSRRQIREKARVLLTNPDMLHLGILPHHTMWCEYFQNLEYIVIDEIHFYRGVFGSHIANVIRRLKRIAKFYGSTPTFILTSATISNPGEHAENLIEEPIRLIDQDGSPRGKRHFIFYNPPIVDKKLGIRKSALSESIRLAGDLLTYGVQTILFGRSRRTVEFSLRNLQERQPDHIGKLRGYRSGYLKKERREVEATLRSGETILVAATSALELGVDIGAMTAVLLIGYPGSIASTLQQVGRAGRRKESSLAVLIATAGPLDQFLMKNPQYLFEHSPESALIDADNLLIMLKHIQCAAFELPFKQNEEFGNPANRELINILNFLTESNDLYYQDDTYYWMADKYPAYQVSIRNMTDGTILLQVEEDSILRSVGKVDVLSAYWLVHPNAIYLHGGVTYLVDQLDIHKKIAHLTTIETDYYTEAIKKVEIQKIEEQQREDIYGGTICNGEVMLTTQVVGYRRLEWFSKVIIDEAALDMPSTDLLTKAFWITLDPLVVESLRNDHVWQNDKNMYGSQWEATRLFVRKRDNYLCQSCGKREDVTAYHVHHKIPFRMFKSSEEANQFENLITLCPKCHQRAELAIRMRSGLTGLGYALHHLAPFYLMCDVSDLGVVTEPNSVIGGGKPTIIVYENFSGGIGLCKKLYLVQEVVLRHTRQHINNCDCIDGCPSCIGAAGEKGVGGKREALAILDKIVRI